MASLPTPGESAGTWGSELNEYLSVGHDSSGFHAEAGMVRQIVYSDYNDYTAGTKTITLDNSIPQFSEGANIMSLAITPKSSSNRLIVEMGIVVQFYGSTPTSAFYLCRDSAPDALAAVGDSHANAFLHTTNLTFSEIANTTSSTTYQMMLGSNNGSYYVNGIQSLGTTIFNGTCNTFMKITEVQV